MASGITWTDRSLFDNLESAPAKFDAAMVAFTHYWAGPVRNYARGNAPWTDQTGNARQGLSTEVEIKATSGGRAANGKFTPSGNRYSIILFHRMPYGIWLEVRWAGRYAIILPTLREMGPKVMGGLRDLLAKMG